MRKFSIVAALALAGAVVATMASCSYGGSGDFNSNGGGTSRGGSMARFTITGDWLYTVNDSQLTVVSIADPEHPQKGDQISIGSGIETIFPMDTLLFIGSQNGMMIYNIKRPEFPEFVASKMHIRSCDPVVAADTLAFVTLNSSLGTWCGSNTNLLQVYDISDIRNIPDPIATVSMTSPRGLAVDLDSKLLFVCDGGIRAYDIADPRNPQRLYTSLGTPGVGTIEAYDCIIMDEGRLLVIGADGLYQLGYDHEKFSLISKIDIRRNQ